MPLQAPPGLFRRLGALVYDFLMLIGVLLTATALLLPFNQGLAFGPDSWAYRAYLFFVSFFFYVWFWTHGGQTLGMKAWKIKLISLDNAPVSWKQAALRFISALFSVGFLGLGFIWIVFNPEKRAWHDLISQTKIIWQDADNPKP